MELKTSNFKFHSLYFDEDLKGCTTKKKLNCDGNCDGKFLKL